MMSYVKNVILRNCLTHKTVKIMQVHMKQINFLFKLGFYPEEIKYVCATKTIWRKELECFWTQHYLNTQPVMIW